MEKKIHLKTLLLHQLGPDHAGKDSIIGRLVHAFVGFCRGMCSPAADHDVFCIKMLADQVCAGIQDGRQDVGDGGWTKKGQLL